MKFTVVWTIRAETLLADMWKDNPAIQAEISAAADEIDREFAVRPEQYGEPLSTNLRQFVQPPLAILYSISLEDRLVRIHHVKFWDESPPLIQE